MSTLERAIAIAVEAHMGQRDKNGAPYILHPLRVLFGVTGNDTQIVAVLHDVVEDCPEWTIARLRDEGFSEEILEAIDSVTRRENETYEEFVRRAAQNPIGLQVKRADLRDNMDVTRLAEVGEKERERLARYLRAWRTLEE